MSSPSKAGASERNPASPCPPEIFDRQVVVPVRFVDFEGREGAGEIVVDRELAEDVRDLFALMLEKGFPIARVVPASDPRFGWDDGKMMAANDSSGFNYRVIANTDKLSWHAYGRAIDLNPVQNPYFHGDRVDPPGATYDPSAPGTIVEGDFITAFMDARGWEWGGRWQDRKDYQHFQKPLK